MDSLQNYVSLLLECLWHIITTIFTSDEGARNWVVVEMNIYDPQEITGFAPRHIAGVCRKSAWSQDHGNKSSIYRRLDNNEGNSSCIH